MISIEMQFRRVLMLHSCVFCILNKFYEENLQELDYLFILSVEYLSDVFRCLTFLVVRAAL